MSVSSRERRKSVFIVDDCNDDSTAGVTCHRAVRQMSEKCGALLAVAGIIPTGEVR
jgi:orotate phosphoribosyltransferase-like protein